MEEDHIEERIQQFLESKVYAVAGASTDRDKYGNKTLRVYQQRERKVYPINPNAETVEGLPAYPDVQSLPDDVEAISIVTPPAVTLDVVRQALAHGIRRFWMQPGAENEEAIAEAEAAGAIVIHGGPCVLVVLRYRE
ncbi:MAG: CoA-binding protein [Bradymonadales bacterium]|nr:CoA-binding protein [Bradymonadales bacterium]